MDINMIINITFGVVLGRFLGWLLLRIWNSFLGCIRDTKRKFKK